MDVFESPGSLSLRHNIKTKIEQGDFDITAKFEVAKNIYLEFGLFFCKLIWNLYYHFDTGLFNLHLFPFIF